MAQFHAWQQSCQKEIESQESSAADGQARHFHVGDEYWVETAAPKAMARLKCFDERDPNTTFPECGNKTMKPIPSGFSCF
jgi:hypothetical protein